MNTLRIPLTKLAESPVLNVDATAEEKAIRPDGVAPAGMRDVHLTGTLSRIDTELYFTGAVSATLDTPCDRCLGEAHVPLEQDVEWYFERGDGELTAEIAGGDITLEYTDEELEDITGNTVRTFSGETLDLGPCVWEELVLAIPSKLLCDNACKGMCPRCGANLNQGPCKCGGDAAAGGHPGLAKLKELYPDLPDRVEE